MARPKPLNPEPAPLSEEPGPLSEHLVRDALATRTGGPVESLSEPAGQLHDLDPAALEDGAERLSFWLNIYNAALLHRLTLQPVSGNLIRHRRIFHTAGYLIGGRHYPLDVIEHGLLRDNRRPPYSARRTVPSKDPRLAGAPSALDPRIHFALNCGARSCPPIRPYSSASVGEQLEAATRGYLRAEVDLDRAGSAVTLPGLMRLYRGDFGPREQQLLFAAENLPDEAAAWLRERPAEVQVRYSRFDWELVPAPGAG